MKTEMQTEIVSFLGKHGVKARRVGVLVAVNRDSMCQSKYYSNGIPEQTAYPAVLSAIEEELGSSNLRFHWCGKTDDDLFMDVIGHE